MTDIAERLNNSWKPVGAGDGQTMTISLPPGDILKEAAAEITALRQQLATARAAAMREAAEKCEAVANPPKGLDCINLSPSGVCNRSGHRDCLCQEREEVADELRLAILALAHVPEGFVCVPVEPTEKMCAHGGLEIDSYDKETDFIGVTAARVYRAMIAKG